MNKNVYICLCEIKLIDLLKNCLPIMYYKSKKNIRNINVYFLVL